jgi:predicted DNA-binding antitoxin AbrB/MazE fold protein
MPITVEATYEGGVLKPAQPLSLKEHEKVRIVVLPASSIAQQTAGMIAWKGDVDTLERVATDPECGILESR